MEGEVGRNDWRSSISFLRLSCISGCGEGELGEYDLAAWTYAPQLSSFPPPPHSFNRSANGNWTYAVGDPFPEGLDDP